MSVLDGHDAGAIEQAAQRLAAGGLVALPTETVYGLAARADDDRAVAAIFATKGRPADHPLIVHVAGQAEAARFAAAVDGTAARLIDAFWPGPLTVIVPRAAGRADAAAAQLPTVALRCPAHPVARSVLVRCAALGVPGLAAPSANRFGGVSPTTAAHVQAEFGDALMVLDGGACEHGIESAIVDCSVAPPQLLRPGALSRARIEAALGAPLAVAGDDATPAPGTLDSHYAPRATLRLMDGEQLKQALLMLPTEMSGLAVYSRSAPLRGSWVRRMPDDAQAVAHELYAVLREFDARGVKLIWVEQPPAAPEWEAVADRLRRAAAS